MARKKLRDGELNPGLPRDRRGYSPLYYHGFLSIKVIYVILKLYKKFKNNLHPEKVYNNMSFITLALNETRLKKIADYEKLKNDITNKKNEMIKKIEEEE